MKNRVKLSKREIIESIHASVGVSSEKVHETIDLLYEAIGNALMEGKTVELRGFGTFEIQERQAHTARNPKTGQRVRVKTHCVVAFRPGRELKQQAWHVKN